MKLELNEAISNMVNEGLEDAVIIYYIFDHSNLSLEESRKKLDEAKIWMKWYAHTSNKERFINANN